MDDRLAVFRAVADAAPEEVVDRAYRLVLRRAPEPGVGEDLAARLARGEISPARLLHDLVTSEEGTRVRALDDAIAFARNARLRDERPRAIPAPPNTDERLVEIPWALSRYRGERRVLDVGYAHAEPAYLAALLAAVPESPTGVDLVEADVPGFTSVVADLRALPFADDSFDVAFCISTLEHVGQDNRLYGHGPGPVPASDDAMLQALHELRRVALRALLFLVVPSYLLTRLTAEWVRSEDAFPDETTWIDIGYIVMDSGSILLIAVLVLGWLTLRQARRGAPARTILAGAYAVAAPVYLFALLVVVWAMTTKPA